MSLAAYDPTRPRITSVMYQPWQNTLTVINLDNQWVSSSADVLQLLAFFPHLTQAYLVRCTVMRASTVHPRASSSQLKWLNFTGRANSALIASLLLLEVASCRNLPRNELVSRTSIH